MKKILSNTLKLLGVILLTACSQNNSSSSSITNNSSSVSFVTSTESFLIEGVDYIDHAVTYDEENYIYNDKMWYINNLDKLPLPDPQIYEENGVYYITGTSDRNNDVIDIYSTKDFITFEEHYEVYNPANYDGWEKDKNPDIYAPEIYCFDGVYYLYYSAAYGGNNRANSVLKADNPVGPYEPIVNDEVNGIEKPLLDDLDLTKELDATIFVDDDDRMYMYYAGSFNSVQYIMGVEMFSPYEADWSTKVDLVKPGYVNSTSTLKLLSWETYRALGPIAEAPFMLKSPNGQYYLTYSVNGCWNKYYSVCYAVSDSPLGNFEKPYKNGHEWSNLLLGYSGTNIEDSRIYNQWTGFASGTGHHCFFNIGDQIMIGYHAHKNRDWNNESKFTQRYFAMDYLYFDNDGVPFCNGPSWSLQPLPKAISGYSNIAENASINVENIENSTAINDNYIVDNYNLKGEEEKEVILGKGTSFVELSFDKKYEIGGIAIYNSAYYGKQIPEVKYIDFGDGNAVYYPQFLNDYHVNDITSFVFPTSAITVEFPKKFTSNKVVICFDLPEGGSINEIKVLGK